LAVSDLVVGVSNDAVNFLNSSVGSRVASRRLILLIASLGMLAGVTFSSGMMEVARKGIFHPQFFTMPELMVIFLAVMLTDIILLDTYNTFGLPTSTTVSIVFELLGAAVMVSLLKLFQAGESLSEISRFINTGKALTIIFGILLSVVIAFLVGAVIQLLSRLLFTFDFQTRLKRYGALWGGVALAAITYFIVIKGAKGASFITAETLAWIRSNTGLMLLGTFAASAVLLQILLTFTRVNILKVIVLVGTFALAMAFAANDLVNFIGVPLAGISAYGEASSGADLTGQTMEALSEPVRANTLFLLIAGAVMVATLWISRKARGVTKTEVSLGRQDDGYERFESTALSRAIVRLVASVLKNTSRVIPTAVKSWAVHRLDRAHYRPAPEADGTMPSFDLVRAGVNVMVASALIAFATSLKLPLSTTYVTFMVAMGTSLSDQAWGRESAVYRVTGVLTVVGGWFFTAMMAFTVASVFAAMIFYGKAPVVLILVAVAVFHITRTHLFHRKRERDEQAAEVFNLRKITDATSSAQVTFEHAGIFLREVATVYEQSAKGLFQYDRAKLREAKAGQRRIQRWSNVIAANIFKVLRLLQWEESANTKRYAETISSLQEISESVRDVVMRGHLHVANQHSGLLEDQAAEMDRIRAEVVEILQRTSGTLLKTERCEVGFIEQRTRALRDLVREFEHNQVRRIQDNTSKTRLSILFYSFTFASVKIAEQTTRLLGVFQEQLRPEKSLAAPAGEVSAATPDTTGVKP
jgi:phosphate/sulfate permease